MGDEDGPSVGLCDGSVDGISVGMCDGNVDGAPVGIEVDLVGEVVGVEEGTAVSLDKP